MKYISMPAIILVMFTAGATSADVSVSKSDAVDTFINAIKNKEDVYRTGRAVNEKAPAPAAYSWTETPEYIYVESGYHDGSKRIFTEMQRVFSAEQYERKYDQASDRTLIRRKKINRNRDDLPLATEKDVYISSYRTMAVDFVAEHFPVLSKQIEFNNYSIETTHCARCNDRRKKIQEVTIFFRRALDGAILHNERPPLQITINAADGTVTRVRSIWKSYERAVIPASFNCQSIPDAIQDVFSGYARGKTGNTAYDKKIAETDNEVSYH